MVTSKQRKLLVEMMFRKSMSLQHIFGFFASRKYARQVIEYLCQEGFCRIDGSNYGYFVITDKGKRFSTE